MAEHLYILTRSEDALVQAILEKQPPQSSEPHIQVVDLTQPNPDYQSLLEAIFVVDSISVW